MDVHGWQARFHCIPDTPSLDRGVPHRYRGATFRAYLWGKAVLLLEDGFELAGEAFGAQGEAFGEVVFNTSLSGYQEVLTDPSYRGQIVTMTYPLIGNYGIVPEDGESAGTWLSGFVVREVARLRSNWRSTTDLSVVARRAGESWGSRASTRGR